MNVKMVDSASCKDSNPPRKRQTGKAIDGIYGIVELSHTIPSDSEKELLLIPASPDSTKVANINAAR